MENTYLVNIREVDNINTIVITITENRVFSSILTRL
jgi:hypothetical protein